jgi:hypothetical protein
MKNAAGKTWIGKTWIEKTWIGAAALAVILMFACSAIGPATAAPLRAAVQKPQASKTTELSARRHTRHYTRYAYRRYYQPYYIDRPYYYAPAPFFPFFGLGYGPLW